MTSFRTYEINLHDDPSLEEQLDPLNLAAEESSCGPSIDSGKLSETMGDFLEEAGKARFDIRSGFYTPTQDVTPRHIVDQEDMDDHRMAHIHTRHPMSLNSKKRPVKTKKRNKKHKKSQTFLPRMDAVSEDIAHPDEIQLSGTENEDGDTPEGSPKHHRYVENDDASVVDGYVEKTAVPNSHSAPEPTYKEMQTSAAHKEFLTATTETDPAMDPGVLSVDAPRGQFKQSLEDVFFPPKSSNVLFVLGDPEGDAEPAKQVASTETSGSVLLADDTGQHRRSHRHHHGRHGASLKGRCSIGSDVCLERSAKQPPTEQDEAKTLSAFDLDEMSSHRLSEAFGVHRRRRVSHSHPPSEYTHKPVPKPFVDHSPHELFVELAELHLSENNEYEWLDTARWIKFEEDVEAEATRYGKPHVSSLSFHSILQLRNVLSKGVVMMDLDADTLGSITVQIVDQLIIADQLKAENKGTVIWAMLLRHRHVRQRSFLRRNDSNVMKSSSRLTLKNLANLFGTRGQSETSLKPSMMSVGSDAMGLHAETNVSDGSSNTAHFSKPGTCHVKIEGGEGEDNSAEVPIPPHRAGSSVFRRIPKGAEATTVLVGAIDVLEAPVMAFVRLKKGCFMGDFTEVPLPVRFIFILLGPPTYEMDYHEIGRSISALMANAAFHNIAYQAEDRQDLLDGINEFLDEAIVLPPGEIDRKTLLPIMTMAQEKSRKKKAIERKLTAPVTDEFGDPLKRTGRPFGGLVNDMRRRYPKYWSDIKDGLNFQCLATFFFIYFACLSPAITFGGLLEEKTEQWMGVSELLVMTSISGILFSLFAAQPLLIIGFTGPIILFEEGLFQFCSSVEIEYMPFRVWICLWVWVIATLVVCFEGSFFVRYFTTFTMEIFSSLISLIFIYEVFYKLYKVFQVHPLQSHGDGNLTETVNMAQVAFHIMPGINETMPDSNETMPDSNETTRVFGPFISSEVTGQPNTALLTLILTLGTFFIAFFLQQFRNSHFFGRSIRRALGDFGIPIAIGLMVTIDYHIQETYTQKLSVPDGIKPTAAHKRGWFINPLGMDQGLPVWAYFAALIPALLVFILIFMESQITGSIISKKVKKGTGFHLDLFLIGCFSIFSGFLGLPLITVATVRSVSHVSALSVFSTMHAPGEKPKLVDVKEQRLTGLAVHIMIGVSVLMGPVLRKVPLAVLFGVFLYMGIASMKGVQFFERLEMMFIERKHYPDRGYFKSVKTMKIHLYTFLQLVCLCILWVVKSTKASLAFPFFLLLMVPLRRHLLVHIFTKSELACLDRDDDQDTSETEEDEPDFYQQIQMPV